jgi:hypothetical protein
LNENTRLFMKPLKVLLTLSFIIWAIFITCSKDNSGSKVGIAKGKISLIADGKTVIYNISTLQSVVSGDTTTVVIRAVNKDSASEFLVIGFQRMVNFKKAKYNLNGIFDYNPDTTFVYAYLHFEGTKGFSDKHFPKGSIDVVDYISDDLLQAKLSFEIPNLKDTTDSTAVTKVTGEINLDYAFFDPEKVVNLPISPGTMIVNINDSSTTLKAVSAHITSNGQNKYSLNGTLGTKTIVIEFNEITPKINQEYHIADTSGLITATYSTNNETSFRADSGTVKISKLTTTTLQGYFDFSASLLKDKKQKKVLKKGMFYAKMKNL